MIDPAPYLAFTTGLLGSGHCIGMCGGLVAAFSLSMARTGRHLLFQALYNVGRVTTYTLAGAALGRFGSMLAYTNAFHGVMRLALLGSDAFIIAVGLGSAGVFASPGIFSLESASTSRLLASPAAALRRLPPALAALPLGLLMGFLPCGFSYAIAITAAQSASAAGGALIMLFFGLGTAPALIAFGSTAQWLSAKARRRMVRGAGAMVALLGAYNLYKHLDMLGWSLAGPLQFLCH